MAKNARVGEVRERSQLFNFITRLWQKRDLTSGKFIDVKNDGHHFKGVKRENRKRK
ncbi:MAG TPA: hypothetical protein VLE91_00485 [Candidatus Saccharimonadales bacterium]|nr:hypothetical protein [Candidatus Saccharimonadales bacterium]